jgi:urea transport system ATP-binding protein
MKTHTALYINGLSVSFGGFAAITNLTLEIRYGETRAIIGPNGAGKTTLMDVITGKTRPTRGEVFFDKSVDLSRLDEAAIARRGIGRKFQKPSVFEALRVEQNVELAVRKGQGYPAMLASRLNGEQRTRIDEVLETIGLADSRSSLAGTLSHGQKQWLEIGMLLVQEPELLMLDEPVAGMSVSERARTAELLELVSKGRSVIVIEHDMKFVESIADRVTVLHQGKVLAEGSMATIQDNAQVKEVYLGH